jgi:Gpi18-like mannosyltransferase
MEKSRIEQFPINNDLATKGHKLQRMTKKFLIISTINYSTPNWVNLVLSSYYIGWCISYATIKTKFQSKTDKITSRRMEISM